MSIVYATDELNLYSQHHIFCCALLFFMNIYISSIYLSRLKYTVLSTCDDQPPWALCIHLGITWKTWDVMWGVPPWISLSIYYNTLHFYQNINFSSRLCLRFFSSIQMYNGTKKDEHLHTSNYSFKMFKCRFIAHILRIPISFSQLVLLRTCLSAGSRIGVELT
jgi:hypothetical protein